MSIITISRGTFSGGQILAERLAEKLGYRCISREALIDVATHGIPWQRLNAAMEEPSPFWERLSAQRTMHLAYVRAALCEHALKGNLVFHGYVGHLLLPGISHVLGVRAIADMDYRIKAAMKQQSLSREDAISYIEKVDRERAEWTGFIFGVQWEDAYLYDVVVNLSRVSLDTACDVVARMAEQKEFRPTAASTRALERLALSTRVSVALLEDDRTAAAIGLQVSADGGVVTITGPAQPVAVVNAIPRAAGQVEGVTELRCKVATARTRASAPRGGSRAGEEKARRGATR